MLKFREMVGGRQERGPTTFQAFSSRCCWHPNQTPWDCSALRTQHCLLVLEEPTRSWSAERVNSSSQDKPLTMTSCNVIQPTSSRYKSHRGDVLPSEQIEISHRYNLLQAQLDLGAQKTSGCTCLCPLHLQMLFHQRGFLSSRRLPDWRVQQKEPLLHDHASKRP